MLKRIWLDVVLATAFIFGLMGLFGSITAFRIFDVFDPIGDALGDMEIIDAVFSQMREEPVADENVLLVNIGNEPRAGIAEMISIMSSFGPKVIGVDAFFKTPKDSIGDMFLEMSIAEAGNIVLASKMAEYNEETDRFDSLILSHPRFTQHAEIAFASLITGAEEQDALKMCRTFSPKERIADSVHRAFAVRLASYLEPEKADKFIARGNDTETINYRGNVLDFGASKFGTMFAVLDYVDVYERNFAPEFIKDKIVIFCFLGDYLGDRQSREDKFFTPLNQKYAGRSEPDMFGGVIHANIVSMIINEDYIDEMGTYTPFILAIFLCMINVALFSLIYMNIPRWYDGITKLTQLLELAIMLFVILWVFDKYSFKLDLTIAMVAVALVGDSLEVYYGVIKNLFSREARSQLLSNSGSE